MEYNQLQRIPEESGASKPGAFVPGTDAAK
jgi:hypothetical protein